MLTEKQEELLRFIKVYRAENGFQPGYKEMKEKLKIKHNNSILSLLKGIEAKGYIKRTGKSRCIILLNKRIAK